LQGGPQLAAALNRVAKAVSDDACAQAVLAGGEVLAEEWKRTVPVKDGHYRNSITAVSSPGNKGATGLVYPADVPGLPDNEQPRRYAARLEFGSMAQTLKMLKRGQAAQPSRARKMQPSLRPAFDNVHQGMVDAIADELGDIIQRNFP
jgi:HK97 gp10 family phage protein